MAVVKKEPRRGNRLFSSPTQRTAISIFLTIGMVAGVLLTSERPAYGYIDPGSGLLSLQLIGAWFAGAFFVFRHKLKALVARKPDDRFEEHPSSTRTCSEVNGPMAHRD